MEKKYIDPEEVTLSEFLDANIEDYLSKEKTPHLFKAALQYRGYLVTVEIMPIPATKGEC